MENRIEIASERLMEIPSDVKLIRQVSLKIEDSLKKYNVDESVLFDIRLSVEEAVRNAIVHGNKSDRKIPVSIDYTIEKGRVAIEVEDKGKGFDEFKVPDPTLNDNLYKEGGRGVFLIHKFMDEVHYNEKGNKVIMVKYLPR